jgi:hypothetical protein
MFHVPAALPLGKETSVVVDWLAGWVPELVWTQVEKGKVSNYHACPAHIPVALPAEVPI